MIFVSSMDLERSGWDRRGGLADSSVQTRRTTTKGIALSLGRRRKLGHRFGTFRHGMLGQFSGKHETNGGLNFATTQGGFLVVRGQFTSFGGDAFENVVDERVHDRHALFGNARIRMHLLQDLVNIRRVRFGTLLVLGRLAGGGFLGSLGGGLLRRCFCHGESCR
jgi:hypothetical protein